jgi:tRNA dimethylallyltransferase
MIAAGGLDEVAALRARRLDPALPVMRAIGVPELSAHLAGEISLDEAVSRAQAATRQYAKRQYTWFRHQPPPEWQRFDGYFHDAEIADLAIKLRNSILT